MGKIVSICLLLIFAAIKLPAQEFQAKVTVLTQQLSTSIDKKIFNTLQSQLTNLMNNRKWTTDVYQPQEKIQCNFLLNIDAAEEDNVYSASLTVQASRPTYHSAYQTALLNFKDVDVSFKYVEYQPIEFNENRVGGNDPLSGNLTAVFAFYAYMILGLDYDSFSPKGGEPFFKKAQNIVNNAPESRTITGWKSFDGMRNRYWLAENMVNNRYNMVHDIIYNYYRAGLDNIFDDEEMARENLMNALSQLKDFNQQNPNTMFAQMFVQGKSMEYIGIFKKAAPPVKSSAVELLSKIDVANASEYKAQLK